eukprot:scaffold3716_cov69-Cylindrotheca_fusiformis.AAC.26
MDEFRSVGLSGPNGTEATRRRHPRLVFLLVLLSFACLLFSHTRFVLDDMYGEANSTSSIQTKATASQHEMPFCNRSQLRQGRWVKSNAMPAYDLHNEECDNSDYNATDSYDWEPRPILLV